MDFYIDLIISQVLSLLYDPNPYNEDDVSVEAVAFSRDPSLPVAAVAIIQDSSWGRLLIWDIKKFVIFLSIYKYISLLFHEISCSKVEIVFSRLSETT